MAGGGPDDIEGQEILVEPHGRRRRMAKRRNAADRKTRGGAHALGIRPLQRLAKEPRGGLFIDAIGARDEKQIASSARGAGEQERLDDLRDGATASGGGLLGG